MNARAFAERLLAEGLIRPEALAGLPADLRDAAAPPEPLAAALVAAGALSPEAAREALARGSGPAPEETLRWERVLPLPTPVMVEPPPRRQLGGTTRWDDQTFEPPLPDSARSSGSGQTTRWEEAAPPKAAPAARAGGSTRWDVPPLAAPEPAAGEPRADPPRTHGDTTRWEGLPSRDDIFADVARRPAPPDGDADPADDASGRPRLAREVQRDQEAIESARFLAGADPAEDLQTIVPDDERDRAAPPRDLAGEVEAPDPPEPRCSPVGRSASPEEQDLRRATTQLRPGFELVMDAPLDPRRATTRLRPGARPELPPQDGAPADASSAAGPARDEEPAGREPPGPGEQPEASALDVGRKDDPAPPSAPPPLEPDPEQT